MPIAQALVTRYFQLIVSRQFAEAERELERVKQKMQRTEWNRGYFRALYGMYLSRKNNADDYAFFNKVDLSDKVALNNYRKEFLLHMGNGLHGDFDRGYFSAWADCMRIISRMNIAAPEKPAAEQGKQKNIETTRNDRSQATIANFLQETSKVEKAVEEENKSIGK
ncbi:hypothetical protein GX563_00460 [Candidatus Bathyarchaeota archaeon]|nr:hypothetical protein [Candidatus Bathyarchaeota archaeon]